MTLDPNNHQYFALNAEPVSPQPWWKKRQYQMRALMVLGAVIGVGAVGYYGYQMYRLTYVDSSALQQAQNMIDAASERCANADDVAACEAAARTNAAQETGEVSVCDGLRDQFFANCVSLIARDQRKSSVCAVLSGDDKTACLDGVTLLIAVEEKEYAQCATIVDETMKRGCEAQLVASVIAAGECEAYGIDVRTCDFPAALERVIAAGDPAACEEFTGDQRSGCDDMFASIDADGDGLTLSEEFQYGTSDATTDTDGDGYTDAEEIATGHDPLK